MTCSRSLERIQSCCLVAKSCPTLCNPMDCSTPSFLVLHHLLEFASQTHAHWVSDAVQPSHHLSPLLLLPLISPSIRVFSSESSLCIRWPKYWRFSFSSSPSNDYSGLISFRIDWFDLFAFQRILKSHLQHHSLKASIQHSTFFMVQLSHLYMTAGKTIQWMAPKIYVHIQILGTWKCDFIWKESLQR